MINVINLRVIRVTIVMSRVTSRQCTGISRMGPASARVQISVCMCLSVCIYMYVCYVCMHACMYVGMYVGLSEYLHLCM